MYSLRPNITAGIPRFATLPDGVYDLALDFVRLLQRDL